AKFAVADVTGDGKDDLVALYDESENKSGLLVFRSIGSSFTEPEKWWDGEIYSWNRARAFVAVTVGDDELYAGVSAYPLDNFDCGCSSMGAADVTVAGKDDVVAVYGDADGSAKVQVFDSGNSFQPAGGFGGWASLPAGSACAGATAVLLGDWNGDRRVDVDALAPADGIQVRSNLLRNMGWGFKVTSTSEETVCPRWPLTRI